MLSAIWLSNNKRYGDNLFQGGVLDTVASRTCIGFHQAKAYCKLTGQNMVLYPPNTGFSFGDTKAKCLGILDVSIPTPEGNVILPTHVVEQRVPFLIGADALDDQGGFVKNTTDQVVCEKKQLLGIV